MVLVNPEELQLLREGRDLYVLIAEAEKIAKQEQKLAQEAVLLERYASTVCGNNNKPSCGQKF